jgi:DNA helicase-2/ATP-dependent DNA helicase PcrA
VILSPKACLEGMNDEQRKAVETIEGPLLILAGAGSGKTRVLTRRVAYMLAKGVPPWQILAVTFTNKAAGEMRARVRDLSGPDADRVLVSTFHSACVRFLRQDIEAIGYKRNFTIYDSDDQSRLLKNLAKEANLDIKAYPISKLRSGIEQAKVRMQDAEAFASSRQSSPGDPLPKIYRGYEEHLKVANAVDFNDLLNLTVKMLQEHPEIRKRYQDRFRYVMVDEYQDTNRAQYLLIKLLAGEHRNLAVVGDDDQSIYAFRGADIRNILDFERDFPEVTTVRLERNYRSTQNILKAAHGVVSNNRGRMEKELWTDVGSGDQLQMIIAQDDMEEANRVLREIHKLRSEGRRCADFAIIYRTNAASRPFEQALVRSRIPHVLVGARKFYERREIRDMLAYLKLVLNPTDNMAFLRVINVPARGLGAKAIRDIQDISAAQGIPYLSAAEKWGAGKGRGRKGAKEFCELIEKAREQVLTMLPGELVGFVAEESGYAPRLRAEETPEAQGRLENIQELVRAVDEDAVSSEDLHPIDRLQAFMDRASLTGQDANLPGDIVDEGQVTLLTAHLAKGLEYPVVFCVGMVEGGFPHHRSREREEDLEEERRLVYVAFTRAMERLYLTRSRRRLVFGRGFQPAEPSRFIDEIPEEVLGGDKEPDRPAWARPFSNTPSSGFSTSQLSGSGGRKPSRPTPAERPADLRTFAPDDPQEFQPGTRVMHPTFGLGAIQKVDGINQNLKLQIRFDRHGTKSLYVRFAKLEVVLP